MMLTVIQQSLQQSVSVNPQVAVTVRRGAESWQFWAFIFAACTGLLMTVVDDLWSTPRTWRGNAGKIVVKMAIFVLLFYLIVVNVSVRSQMTRFLEWIVTEHYH